MVKRALYFGNPCYLSTKMGQLILNYPDFPEARKSIPIEDIGFVLLDHPQITITQALINNFLQNNVVIVHCDEKHLPVALSLSMENNHTYTKKLQAQIYASLPLKKKLWQQTVVAKIKNQAALLDNEDVNPQKLNWLASRVQSGDPENCEGRAAAYYWEHYFGLLEKAKKRGREEDPPNNLLNYAYAVIRAIIARALVGSGMMPVIGIHHRNKYNPFCLADDIMEPYRPVVDGLVLDICREEDEIDILIPALKVKLLQIISLDVNIEGQKSPLMVAASRTTASLMQCFEGSRKKIKYPVLDFKS